MWFFNKKEKLKKKKMYFYVKHIDEFVKRKNIWEIHKGQPFNEGGREIFNDEVAIAFSERIYEGKWEVFDKFGSFKVISLDECDAFYISYNEKDLKEISKEEFKKLFTSLFEK